MEVPLNAYNFLNFYFSYPYDFSFLPSFLHGSISLLLEIANMIHALVVVYRLLTFFAISSVADRDILEIYRQFLIDHNHDGTRIHDPARLVAFSESLNYIKNHPGTSYGVKLNEMADWLPHEFNARFVSVQTNEEQPRQVNRPPLLRTGNDFMIHTEGQSSSDPIAIDWATSLNPTGKGTISIVRNQGLCGACWAFVAAASVESLARIGGGKQISLSVQELVDCDNSYNKGCEGGNPLYAYEYVKLNALTSWEDYPYKELESTCHRRKYRPIAAVEDYKKLPENDQMVLKHYVGQVKSRHIFSTYPINHPSIYPIISIHPGPCGSRSVRH